MKPGFFAKLLIVAALVGTLGFATTGCGDDISEITEIVNQFFTNTRADSIMTSVKTYWFKPSGLSINSLVFEVQDFRLWCSSFGTAIYAYEAYDDDDDHLFMGYIDSSGNLYRPVCIGGDFYDPDVEDVNLVFNQHGDAAFTFVATQYADVSDTSSEPDEESSRVYYSYFRSSFAGTEDNGDGLEYGFRTWAGDPLDRNTPGDDEDGLSTVFNATNLILGPQDFSGFSNNTDEACSGSHGLSLDWFLFFGWKGNETDDSGTADPFDFIEGVFIDLDNSSETYLMPLNSTPLELDTDPELTDNNDGDSIGSQIFTSGIDIGFEVTEGDNGDVQQEYFNLVRVDLTDPSDPDLDDAISVARGDGDSSTVSVSPILMVGNSIAPFTGITGTWILMTESGYAEGSTVTNEDTDLLIARVDADGTVNIDEFDTEDPDSSDSNDVSFQGLQFARGLTHGIALFNQNVDPTGTSPSSTLFAVGMIWSDGTFANLISSPVQVSPNEDDEESDTNIHDVNSSEPNGLMGLVCGPDPQPLSFGVTYSREVDDDSNLASLNFARIEFDAVEEDPSSAPSLTASNDVIIEQDVDWDCFSGGVETGGGPGQEFYETAIEEEEGYIVIFGANGNNVDDDGATGSFCEPRTMIWTIDLAEGDINVEEFGSSSVGEQGGDDLPFPDFYESHFYSIGVTPGNSIIDRDSAFDIETLSAEWLHVFLTEDNSSVSDSTDAMRFRAIDLNGTFASAETDRIIPGLDEYPNEIVDKVPGPYVGKFMSEGNNATIFLRYSTFNDDPIYVSTFNTGDATWVCPALVSNEVGNSGLSGYLENAWFFCGWTTTTCCPRIQGGWTFWVRYGGQQYYLQGRRITGLTLSEE